MAARTVVPHSEPYRAPLPLRAGTNKSRLGAGGRNFQVHGVAHTAKGPPSRFLARWRLLTGVPWAQRRRGERRSSPLLGTVGSMLSEALEEADDLGVLPGCHVLIPKRRGD